MHCQRWRSNDVVEKRREKDSLEAQPSIEGRRLEKKKIRYIILGKSAAETLNTEKKYGGNDRQQFVAVRSQEECCR